MIHTQDADFLLLCGDVLEELATLPDESVHCVVTSPPYWGLRDYGTGEWEPPLCELCEAEGEDRRMEPDGEGGWICRWTTLHPSDQAHKIRPHEHEGSERYYTEKTAADSSAGAFSEPGEANKERLKKGRWREKGSCIKCGAQRQDKQLGLEPTPDLYVARMVEVFREVRRVLRTDGTCWVNLGDSYAAGPAGNTVAKREIGNAVMRQETADALMAGARRNKIVGGLKPKDLVGIPWRVAFALQADGWYLRADIIWAKPNPMPESVTDRPTKAHEYVFLLTKSARYFFDQEAVREPFDARPQQRLTKNVDMPLGAARIAAGVQQGNPQGGTHVSRFAVQSETLGDLPPESPRGPDGRRKTVHDHATDNSHPNYDHMGTGNERWPNSGRNVRSVWEIATQPYPEAHFATYPEELVRRCILAGTSEHGCCPVCGKPWERETGRIDQGWDGSRYGERAVEATGGASSGGTARSTLGSSNGRLTGKTETLGWRSGCDCEGSGHTVPATILDPFLGSGTTAYVARKHGRRSIGIELNPAYADLAAKRMAQQSLFALEETP